MKITHAYCSVFFTTILGVFFINNQGQASNQEELSPGRIKVTPNQISASGKHRLQEHISIISENMKNTRTNLSSTKKNIGVIEAEIKDLDGLEKEHLDLKARYLTYLSNAAQEIEKNSKGLVELQKFEKKIAELPKNATAPNASNDPNVTAQKTQIEIAKREKLEREKWQTEAQAKISRVNELLKGIEKNIGSINSRKAPLQGQLRTWNDRRSEYENTLRNLTQKKTDDERLLASLKH